MLHIDMETQSSCDLSTKGSYEYAIHTFSRVMCMAYSINDAPIELWTPDQPFPIEIKNYVSKRRVVSAHNAVFEFNIWNNCLSRMVDVPRLVLEQVECTMAKCYYHSLPGSLDQAAQALGLKSTKDMAGKRVMLQLSSPRKIINDIPIFYEKEDVPEKFQILYEYCKNDVQVERDIHTKLKSLPEIEKRFWRLDYQINQVGVEVDQKSIKLANRIIDEEKEELDRKMNELTDGKVFACSAVSKLTAWLKEKEPNITKIGKADVKDLLKKINNPVVKEALELRQVASKSSTAKLQAMHECVGSDGRIKEMFQYYGAHTGRFAGRKVQLQNFPRPTLKHQEIESIFDIINQFPTSDARTIIDSMYAPPLSVISDCLRGFIKAKEGHRFLVVDWSAIEARVLAWLAGQEDILKVFRNKQDLYITAASKIYGKKEADITKHERQIGKVATLALGYQGGVRAFQLMSKSYGLEISDDEADTIKKAWRESNYNIVKYWYALNDAAIKAVQEKVPQSVGQKNNKVTFVLEDNFLKCKLPSGRDITYPYPKVDKAEHSFNNETFIKDALQYKGRSSVSKKWIDIKTYGGKFSEQITQGLSRDILRDALLALNSKGYKTVMHIHDEIVCEMPEQMGSIEEMKDIMCSSSPWSDGLPLGAEGWEGLRYGKE